MKILPAQPDLAELLRRLNAPPVPLQPRGGVATVPVSKIDPGKAAMLPNPGTALPNLGTALPELPSSPQLPNGFPAAPKLQLLLDAVGGNDVARPSLPQDPLLLRDQSPARSPERDLGMGRIVDHGADGARHLARAEPQRITEQFWHSEVRPSLEARRELMSRLDEQGGAPPLLQHPPVRSELGMPPGVQLLAALQAGLQTAPGTSAARMATTPSEADGKLKPKRTAGGAFPSLSAERIRRRSYLVAATMAGLMVVLAAAKSCSAF